MRAPRRSRLGRVERLSEKCGFANQPGYQFCSNCGSAITAGPPPSPSGAPPGAPGYAYPPPAFAYGPSPWDMQRRKQIDRTKTGLLLLLIGALLGWIPFIAIIGGLLTLIGALLVILGRKAFGPTHSRNVMISLVMYIVGIIGFGVFAVIAALNSLSGFIGGTQDPAVAAQAFASTFNTILLGGIVLGAVLGIANVLFTYGLQNPTGRMLLWGAFGAGVVISVVTYVLVAPLINAMIANPTDINAVFLAQAEINAQIATLGLLTAVSSFLYAGADYIAWSRVNRGELPAPAAGPVPGGMPPGGAPPGEMPPPIHPK